MSQGELANVGKFVLALFGYFIGTGVMGFIISWGDEDTFPIGAWVIGGFAFGVLAIFV